MSLVVWSATEAERLLSPLGTRWAHSAAVARRADQLAARFSFDDRETVVAAAYLHDVGYAAELSLTGFHPLDGARWLWGLGHERLAGLVAHHTGARFEAQSRGLVDALKFFPAEQSVVADVLTFCDLTTGPAGESVTPSARLNEIDDRYGRDSEVSHSLHAAETELNQAVERVQALIAA